MQDIHFPPAAIMIGTLGLTGLVPAEDVNPTTEVAAKGRISAYGITLNW